MPISLWITAARPRTLTMAAAPVLVGTAAAWHLLGAWRPLVFVATLLAAALIQIGTNLLNDASDGEQGGDGPDRLGPLRVTGAGLMPASRVRRAALACLALAFLLGLYLVAVGGVVILAIGLASIAAACAYSGGPRPLSHGPLGELYVIVFFGILAVIGSFYLQTGAVPSVTLWLLGFAVGCFAAAALLVNNVRDELADRKAGRRTLAGRLGRRRANVLYALLMLLPFLLILPAAVPRPWIVWLAVPWCVLLGVRFAGMRASPAMNGVLAQTALVQLLFCALLGGTLLL